MPDATTGAVDAAGVATTGVPWGSVIQGGASLFNGVMGASSQSDINSANIANSQAQRDFEERMANTAHQREVADLIKAGLNPILSVNHSGAPMPSYQLPQLASPYQAGVSAAGGVAKAALDYAHSSLANKQGNTEDTRTDIGKSEARIIGLRAANATQLLEKEFDLKESEIAKVKAVEQQVLAERKFVDARTYGQQVTSKLLELDLPEARSMAHFWSSAYGQKAPFVREGVNTVGGIVSSASKAVGSGLGLRATRAMEKNAETSAGHLYLKSMKD